MPEHAKITGYTQESIHKMLCSFKCHPVKGKCRQNRVLDDLEYFEVEVSWTSISMAKDPGDDRIPPLMLRSFIPRGMQGLFERLQSFNGRSVQSLPALVKEHFLVANTNRLKEVNLDIKCSFSGTLYS